MRKNLPNGVRIPSLGPLVTLTGESDEGLVFGPASFENLVGFMRVTSCGEMRTLGPSFGAASSDLEFGHWVSRQK